MDLTANPLTWIFAPPINLLLVFFDNTPFLYHGIAVLVFVGVLLKEIKSLQFIRKNNDLNKVFDPLIYVLIVCSASGAAVMWPVYLLCTWYKRRLDYADVILGAEQHANKHDKS